MQTINMHDAKSQLSKLVERALAGETVIIAKAGVPVVRLVPTYTSQQERRPGRLRGQIRIGPDFDQTPESIIAAFEGD